MKTFQFAYSITTDCIYGSKHIKRSIYIAIENHPDMGNVAFERLDVEDVKTLRDVCDQVLKEVKHEDERHEAAAEAAGK